jgi:hypothetical protein
MALNKDFKDYSYNLGRTVAVVEIINGLRQTFASDVANNAKDKLPYQLTEALKKTSYNIHKELLEPADVVLNHGELPSKPVTTIDQMGRYWIGYYHEKAYLADTYKGIFGKVETTIEEHVPEHIDVPADTDNTIDDLKR